jgi:hypothetical protein
VRIGGLDPVFIRKPNLGEVFSSLLLISEACSPKVWLVQYLVLCWSH